VERHAGCLLSGVELEEVKLLLGTTPEFVAIEMPATAKAAVRAAG
jgi:hypothetical protein